MVQAIRQRSAYGGRTTGPVNAAFMLGGAQYAMSDNPFDTAYSYTGIPGTTYSETNHRALFATSNAVTSVARLLTGYGVVGQVRGIEFESMVFAGGSQNIGLRPSLTQGTTGTGLTTGTNDISYSATLGIYVNGVQISTDPPTWGAGDKIGIVYNATLGTAAFYLNGANVYIVSNISGDYTPACQGGNSTTSSIRVSASWSYTLPGGALYWR